MSWAAHRETSRKEDEAYCLLGLFEVNMPLLYGEEEKAFTRLQEEIIRSNSDQRSLRHLLAISQTQATFNAQAEAKQSNLINLLTLACESLYL